ncbi:MAG: helix-turn-helix domain-containing protein [Chloroflexi bacterium]|nr:helix-turn-helix domain-containing protein [Chloroflexota bacterium]
MESLPEILTPEQAAEYLQISRAAVYRLIRDGKLAANKLGRAYRIPRGNLELLLWTTPVRPDLRLREYTAEEIAGFLEDDRLDDETREIADRFWRATAPNASA